MVCKDATRTLQQQIHGVYGQNTPPSNSNNENELRRLHDEINTLTKSNTGREIGFLLYLNVVFYLIHHNCYGMTYQKHT